MHKGVILLVKSDNKDEVAAKVNTFMEDYGNGNVWDWFVIGGRWSGSLNPLNAQFDKLVKEKYPPKETFGYTDKEVKENAANLQALWESIGGTGINPWGRDQYKQKTGDDDIVPLATCLDIVKDWRGVGDDKADKELAEGKRWLEEHPGDKNMYGYFLKNAGRLYQQEFCFECNVYNTDSWNYEIPESPEGWFAVMVDMHN